MRNQYKVLAEKYEAIQENSEESVMSTDNILGYKAWLSKKNGLLHRTDGPAYIYDSGDKEWWVNGMRHRLDGPAVEQVNGIREWWVNNKRHRTDGPARDLSKTHGIVEWYQNDKLHRLDGPAVIHTFKGGDYPPQKHYYINGVEYEKEEYLNRVNTLKGLEDLARIRSKQQ